MNTDKIFSEAIVNEYAPKDTSKVVVLKKLDRKAKSTANIFAYTANIKFGADASHLDDGFAGKFGKYGHYSGHRNGHLYYI